MCFPNFPNKKMTTKKAHTFRCVTHDKIYINYKYALFLSLLHKHLLFRSVLQNLGNCCFPQQTTQSQQIYRYNFYLCQVSAALLNINFSCWINLVSFCFLLISFYFFRCKFFCFGFVRSKHLVIFS